MPRMPSRQTTPAEQANDTGEAEHAERTKQVDNAEEAELGEALLPSRGDSWRGLSWCIFCPQTQGLSNTPRKDLSETPARRGISGRR